MMPAMLKDAETFRGRALPYSLNRLDPNPVDPFHFYPSRVVSSTNTLKPCGTFTFSLISAFSVSGSGSRSSSTSSAWCQQSQLIKAVGAQCVIHSYS